MEFQDLDVVVTGGTGALGTAVVAALLREGAACHIPNRSGWQIDRFPHGNHDRVNIVPDVDLGDEAAVSAFYQSLPPLWGSIHVAGGFAMAPIADAGAAAFEHMMTMNARTCYLCCRAAIHNMRGQGRGGRIVNVAARPALEPRTGAGMVAYAASKAAVAAMTQAMAEEVAADGIWVNAIAPSILDTPTNRSAMPGADFAAWPKVEEVAETILALAAPRNGAARGGVVPLYGRS